MGDDPPRYRFGPLERRGLIAGWRGGQIAVGGGGLVVGVLVAAAPIRTRSASLAALSAGPRSPWRRLLAARRPDRRGVAADGGALGRRRSVGGPALALSGGGPVPRVRDRARTATRVIEPRVPASFAARWSWVPARPGPTLPCIRVDRGADALGSSTGIVHDRRTGTFTAALALEGHSFALLGADEKERRVGGWAACSPRWPGRARLVHRVQWLAIALPDDGRAVHATSNSGRPSAEADGPPLVPPAARARPGRHLAPRGAPGRPGAGRSSQRRSRRPASDGDAVAAAPAAGAGQPPPAARRRGRHRRRRCSTPDALAG